MRGVNKLVLEIKPESDYFEKAILFINPDKLSSPQNDISVNADKILSVIYNTKNYKKSRKLKTLLLISISAAGGSFVSLLFILISGLNL